MKKEKTTIVGATHVCIQTSLRMTEQEAEVRAKKEYELFVQCFHQLKMSMFHSFGVVDTFMVKDGDGNMWEFKFTPPAKLTEKELRAIRSLSVR